MTTNLPTLAQTTAIISLASFVDFHTHKYSRIKSLIALQLILKNNLFDKLGPAILRDHITAKQASDIIDALVRDNDDEAFALLSTGLRLRYPDIISRLEAKHADNG